MPDNRHTNLLRTIVELYRNHWRLLWCIMLPVAICAIALYIVQVIHLNKQLEEDVKMPSDTPSRQVYTAVSSIGTAYGIHSTVRNFPADIATNTDSLQEIWQIFPIPSITVTNNAGITWRWEPNKVGSFYYTRLILLLLALCPLSLAVARISQGSQTSDDTRETTPLTAREMWWQTGRKAFTVFAAFLLFILIVDVGGTLVSLITWAIPSLNWVLPITLLSTLVMISHYYFLVTLSLYNPCLILENNSIIGIFRRSHALVSGARLRFLGIYLLAGWIISTITSVLTGIALLVFSIFIPDLAPIHEVLPLLKFLTFFIFIGADIEIVLPQLLGTPVTVAILIVSGMITTFLFPIWAILTTRLYLERVRAI